MTKVPQPPPVSQSGGCGGRIQMFPSVAPHTAITPDYNSAHLLIRGVPAPRAVCWRPNVYLFFALQCMEDLGTPWIILGIVSPQTFMHETYNCTKSTIWEAPLHSLLTTLLLCLRHPNHRHKSQVNPKSHPGIKMKTVFFSIPVRSEFDHEIGIVTIKMQNKMEFEMWI